MSLRSSSDALAIDPPGCLLYGAVSGEQSHLNCGVNAKPELQSGKDLTPASKTIHLTSKSRTAWSARTLASRTGLSRETAQHLLRLLED